MTRFDFLGEGTWSPPGMKATFAPTLGTGAGKGTEIKETSLPPVKKTAKAPALDDAAPSGPPSRWHVKTADFGSKSAGAPSPWSWANGKPKPLWTDEEPFPWPEASPEKGGRPKSSFQGHYTTRRGDTLAGIAERFKVSLGELKRLNGLAGDQARVRAGTLLIIPARMDAPKAPPRVVQVKPLTGPMASLEPPVPVPVPKGAARKGGGEADEPRLPPGVRKSLPEAKEATKEATTATAKDAAKDAPTGVRFRWPVAGGQVLSTFGARPDGSKSEGIKLAVPPGTDIQAAESGRVHYAGDGLKGYGNLILIRHANNDWVSTYAHLSKMLVKVGDEVKRGQVIGKSGQTGPVDVPQLGFELRKGSVPVNPLEHLPRN